MRALILGAGFSKWAADLPVVSQLFDMEVSARTDREDKRLAAIERDFRVWESANQGKSPELFVQWCQEKSTVCAKRMNWYVSRRLSDPFLSRILGGNTALMIDEKRTSQHQGVLRARGFLKAAIAQACTGIVSANYDLLIEYALGSKGFHYGIRGEILQGRGINPMFPWQNSGASLEGNIPLAKIHGSLSWSKETKWTSGKPGLDGQALIVAPAPEKTPPVELASVWGLAKNILSRATEIIVFGFAFNPYDEAVLALFKAASPQRVLLVDPKDHRKAASRIWPSAILEWWESADALSAQLLREDKHERQTLY
jgi:hypothetical protein